MIDVVQAIHLTIKGRPVFAPSGETVYQVAKKAGVSTPSRCVSHYLAPFGRVVSVRGEALLPVVGSEPVLQGYLFTSFHFSASTVNALLSSSAGERSKCPEYKVSAVRVEPVERDELDPEDDAELQHMRRQLIV